MFVEDLKNDFYNFLLGKRILVLLHLDVDAICTYKILQQLFKCDNIVHSVVPVGTIPELKSAYDENCEEVKIVVTINCGGSIDLVDLLQPEEDVIFFVLDSHRPSDVCNVYSDGQVRLVWKDPEEKIPNFEDIFRDDDDEEEEEEDVSGGAGEVMVRRAERRRARAAWEERRNTLMFNYTQFSYYARPSACTAMETMWVVRGSCGAGALWAACVAVESGAELCLAAPAHQLLHADALRPHLARLAHDNLNAPHRAHIALEKDVVLPLYRWWSVEGGLRHSPRLGPALRLHTAHGERRLRRLLADTGFPLAAARQAYRSMACALREELCAGLERVCAALGLGGATRPALLLRRPFTPTLAAADLVYVILATLHQESMCGAESVEACLRALSLDVQAGREGEGEGAGAVGGEGAQGESSRGLRGAGAARAWLQRCVALANQLLAARQLHCAGPFNYLLIHEGASMGGRGWWWVGVVARWVAAASAAGGGGGGGGAGRPLVACAAVSPTHTLLLGLPPNHHQDPRNLFGAAFQAAGAQCGADMRRDHLDPALLTLPTAQRQPFLDALTTLLT